MGVRGSIDEEKSELVCTISFFENMFPPLIVLINKYNSPTSLKGNLW